MIYLLLGSALLAGGVASTYLMIRCADVSNAYTAIIRGEIAQAQRVRVLQVTFKKQVQAWKDILLRGKSDADLRKYSAEFHSLGEQVSSISSQLAGQIQDPRARDDLNGFHEQYQVLLGQYEQALQGYIASRDFAATDAALRGKDRTPTDALDQVVDRLSALAESLPEQEAAGLHREQTVLIVVISALWLALAAWSVAFARSLGIRLSRCVGFVREIAAGDLTSQAPNDTRADELGVLIEAMCQMRDRLQSVVASIQTVASYLSTNAAEVANSSEQIAHAVSEQRNEASMVASALEEMIASVREVTLHCNQAASHAAHSGDLAAGSCQTVEAVAGEVRELAAEAERNARTVQELGERSSRIRQIVTLIEEIAGQTNLLALNAAIEAARAGENGRGFAVVAGEVRRLAERTTTATKEIGDAVQSILQGTRDAVSSIEGSSDRVNKSVSTAEAASHSLSVLGTSTAEVRQRIEKIAQAAEEQSQASGLLGKSMNEITASITASAQGATAAAHTSGELVNLARQLESVVSQFRTGAQSMPQSAQQSTQQSAQQSTQRSPQSHRPAA
jgi:methyl-accepting chemotaxis protein